jgi:hypothetical protein
MVGMVNEQFGKGMARRGLCLNEVASPALAEGTEKTHKPQDTKPKFEFGTSRMHIKSEGIRVTFIDVSQVIELQIFRPSRFPRHSVPETTKPHSASDTSQFQYHSTMSAPITQPEHNFQNWE